MTRVLICDDQLDRAKDVEYSIHKSGAAESLGLSIELLTNEELTKELKAVFETAERCVQNPSGFKPGSGFAFDRHDLLLFDNNLAHLDIGGARLTAESMVGYVRAFSECPFIVSLNKNPDVDFDLRYLVGDYETRADMALNTDHLENLALWSGVTSDANGGFCPWYWPTLSEAPKRRRAQVEFVERYLSSGILSALNFPEDDQTLNYLSPHGRGTLVPSMVASDWKFNDVFRERDRSLLAETKDDRARLAEATTDNESVRRIVAKVVAADVELWFRRDLISPQEMLVDVAHLLTRMPFLVAGDPQNLATWNSAAWATEAPFGLQEKFYRNHLKKAQFEFDEWVERPMFSWPRLKGDEELDELFFELISDDMADVVFCEDSSAFRARQDCLGERGSREFSAEFEGSWSRRYVAVHPQKNYRPMGSFAI